MAINQFKQEAVSHDDGVHAQVPEHPSTSHIDHKLYDVGDQFISESSSNQETRQVLRQAILSRRLADGKYEQFGELFPEPKTFEVCRTARITEI